MARALFSEPEANSIESAETGEVGPAVGLIHAISVGLSDTAFILSGRCDVVDYVLADSADFGKYSFRISILRALLRTVVYLINPAYAFHIQGHGA